MDRLPCGSHVPSAALHDPLQATHKALLYSGAAEIELLVPADHCVGIAARAVALLLAAQHLSVGPLSQQAPVAVHPALILLLLPPALLAQLLLKCCCQRRSSGREEQVRGSGCKRKVGAEGA